MTTTEQSPEAYAYEMMAHHVGLRAAAPIDGPPAASLQVEALGYADDFENEHGKFILGYADYPDRPTLAYIVEAARNLNGLNPTVAARLLRMALADIESRHPETLEDTP